MLGLRKVGFKKFKCRVCFPFVFLFLLCVIIAHNDFSYKSSSNQNRLEFKSILAVVTVGWDSQRYEKANKGYLDAILSNYVDMCEFGHKVTVVLCMYQEKNAQNWWSTHLDLGSKKYFCSRVNFTIPIRLEFYEFRKLPKKAFGTKGDLAIRYREIFLREVENFDTFIVQEDDVIFRKETVSYFYEYLSFFQKHGGEKYLPALYDAEVNEETREKYASWRLTNGTFFRIRNKTFFRSGHSIGGRSLILSREMLQKNVLINKKDEWINSSLTQGEFNPVVSSFVWMENVQGTSWKRLKHRLMETKKIFLFPIDHNVWQNSEIHHLPNKYLKHSMKTGEPGGYQNDWLKIVELKIIFKECLRERDIDENSIVDNKLVFTGSSCAKCLNYGGSVSMRTVIHDELSKYIRSIEVDFKCKMTSLLKWF